MSEKQTWYEVSMYATPPEIKEITVVKETEFTVTIEEARYVGCNKTQRRRNKDGEVFPTKQQAQENITQRLTKSVESGEASLKYAKRKLDEWLKELSNGVEREKGAL